MKKYDVIVIGGGISGLGVAALLSNKGYRTILLEKESILGGRCTSFQYRGYTVDTGLHAVASYSSSGIGRMLAEVGAQLELMPIKPSLMHYDLDTRRYMRATSPERFGEALYRDFKELVKTVAKMGKEEINGYHTVSAAIWILDRFKNEALLEFFKKITGFAGQPMEKVSAGAFLETLNDAFNSEATITYPHGNGIKALPDALERAILQKGGEIVTEVGVQKILQRKNRIVGVQAKVIRPSFMADVELHAPAVVFTIPLELLPKFLSRKNIPAELLAKIERITHERYYYTGLIAGVPKSAMDSEGEKFFQWTVDRPGMDWHAIITAPTQMDPQLAPPGRHLLFIDSHGPMPYGDDGIARRRQDELADMLNEIWPGFTQKVDWLHRVIYPNVLPLAQISLTGPYRPGFSIPGLKGMYLAGDATYLTGSGIGSTVKSAYGCIEEIERGNFLAKR
jgi:phytoene dehydrogenase-like protein